MIRMTAEIELLPGTGEIQTNMISISPAGNNISSNISEVVSVRKTGSNPFLFGISKLGSGATFSGGEGYFIGSQPSNESGNFTTPYSVSFEIFYDGLSSIAPNFSIVFDAYNNAYPKNITVSYVGESQGTPIQFVNETPYFVFNSSEQITLNSNHRINFTVTISDWSMPGYPLRIQGIYTGLYIYGNRQNMLSLSAPIKDRSNNEQPSYGIISNAGSLSLVDGTGEIKEYARMGLLTTDLDVSLTLEDTITKKHQSIGKFKTNKWSYDNMNYEVNIELKDDLEQIQEINIPNQFELYYFNDSEGNIVVEDKTAYYIYTQLKSLTTTNEFWNEPSDFVNYLNSFTVKNYYLVKGTLWEQWNKFCIFIQAHMYEQDKQIKFTYNIG